MNKAGAGLYGPAVPSLRIVVWALGALVMAGAAYLRLSGLDHNPPGLWQDEASTGLDAYLLWTTGRDQHGAFLPILARSFGDYPLTLYRYLSAPIVGSLGPSPGTERMVAAMSGTLLVLGAGLWTGRRLGPSATVAVWITAALTPTAILFSRYGSEAILLPTCLVWGALAFEVGREHRAGLWAGAVLLAASAYTYHVVKLFLPLWMIGFLIYQSPVIRRLWHSRRIDVVGPALLFALLVMPSAILALSEYGMARPKALMAWYHRPFPEFLRLIANNYLSYFDPSYVFVRGGRHIIQSFPRLGLQNLIELPLGIYGAVVLYRIDRRFGAFVAYWFFIGPIPGGLTYEAQNVGRTIGWLPAWSILSGVGLWALCARLWSLIAAGGWRWAAGTASGLALLAALLYTVRAVTFIVMDEYPRVAPPSYQYSISASMDCARKNRTDEVVYVSPRFHYARTFARYYFEPMVQRESPDMLKFSEPSRLRSGEMLVIPAGRPKPPGSKEVCTITDPASKAVQGHVLIGESSS